MKIDGLPPLAPVLWLLNAAFATAGQLLLKNAATPAGPVGGGGSGVARWHRMIGRPWLWLGIGCFAVEFLLWLGFLSLVPLSDGVLLGAVNVVAVMVLGRLVFDEALSGLRLAGILLISLGVAVVGLT